MIRSRTTAVSSSAVFALDFHADYRCRHSGACCSADWDVPVELPVYRSLSAAVSQGRLEVAPAARGLAPFVVEPDLPDDAAAMIERTPGGDCVFFERGRRMCVVHRDLGEPALPSTCRHFPRIAVRDARGTSISLSHFCPTAASMLFREEGAILIVEDPRAFPPADYDGLVVNGEDLPPLLAPWMLMDVDAYATWERHMVNRCARPTASPESVIATLRRDALALRQWKPGGGSLAHGVDSLPRGCVDAPSPETLAPSLALHREVMKAVPDDLRPQLDEAGLDEAYLVRVRPAWAAFRVPLNRYLAAKAFASWTAYQGRGIATIVRGLEAALAVVRVESSRGCRDADGELDRDRLLEAIRSADFALNHLAVGQELADAWSRAEEDSTQTANVAITGP
jgi:Fe-S-cluster containining protein